MSKVTSRQNRKQKSGEIGAYNVTCINLNILECKLYLYQLIEHRQFRINLNILECKYLLIDNRLSLLFQY